MAHKRQPDTAVTRRGMMLVLSSPSGAGKTTLTRKLLDGGQGCRAVGVGDDAQDAPRRKGWPRLSFRRSQSNSMRWPRKTSCWNGQRYLTITTARRKKPVMDALAAGRDVLFDVDWQGTQQLRDKAPK